MHLPPIRQRGSLSQVPHDRMRRRATLQESVVPQEMHGLQRHGNANGEPDGGGEIVL